MKIQKREFKTSLQFAAENYHQERFRGMSNREIENLVPEYYVSLFKRATDGNIGIAIHGCLLCGGNHYHDLNTSGKVIRYPTPCNRYGLVYPQKYELTIDFSFGNNKEFEEQYLQQVRDLERNPAAFQKESIQKQRIYHEGMMDNQNKSSIYGCW